MSAKVPAPCLYALKVKATKPHSRLALTAAFVLLAATCDLTAAAQTNFGAVNIGASTQQAVSVSIPGGGTVASISVVTQGVQNLDFTNATGGTCATGATYAANATCTVKVAFSPLYPGTRYGAVVLFNSSNNAIATAYLVGVGNGPQAIFIPRPFPLGNEAILPGTDQFIAVDAGNNLYLDHPDSSGNDVIKATPSSNGTYTTSIVYAGSGSGTPASIALDGSGALYVLTSSNGNLLYKMTPSGSGYTQSTALNMCSVSLCTGPAVDAGGNIFFGDTAGRLWKATLSGGVYTPSVIDNFAGFADVKTDGNDVYVAGTLLSSPLDVGVYKETASGNSYTKSTVVNNLTTTSSGISPVLALDGRGNVFINLGWDGGILEETPSAGGYTQSQFLPPHSNSENLGFGATAVDENGNLYWSSVKFDFAELQEPLIDGTAVQNHSFGYTTNVAVANSGNEPLNFSAVDYPPDFPAANSNAGNCASGTSLALGENCVLPISFLPISSLNGNSSSTLNEDVTITTNTMNHPGTAQAIPVTGTETQPTAAIELSTSADPSTVGTPLTLSATIEGTGFTPTGTVTFYSSNVTLGTASVALGTAALNSSGVATFNPGVLPIGTYALSAAYSGDQNYAETNPSYSVDEYIISGTVAIPTMTISPSSTSITVADPLTVKVTLSGGTGKPIPTGTLSLAGGGYVYSGWLVNTVNGTANLSIDPGDLVLGTDTLTIYYVPDQNSIATYGSVTGSTTVTVTPMVAQALTITATAVSVAPGATTSNTSTITVTPVGGFNGAVTLTAAVTASPANAIYPPTLSVSSVGNMYFANATPQTATLTISTTAPSAPQCSSVQNQQPGVPWYAGGGAVLACVFLLGIPARRRKLRTILGMFALLVALTVGVVACGGGGRGSSSSCDVITIAGTTPGTYTITVTAASGLYTSTGTVTLTVQ
jgi:hypothetical protein